MKVQKIVSGFRSSKFIRPKSLVQNRLEVTDKPLIAKIRYYYSDVGEKLNDIYLERLKDNQSTTIVENNIKAYNSLPDAVKEALKPSDVSYTGHIDQSKINSIWEAAEKAHKPGVYGYPPTFKGMFDDVAGQQVPLFDPLDRPIPDFITKMPETDLAAAIDALGDGLETKSELSSEIMQDAHEHGAGLLEHIVDLFG